MALFENIDITDPVLIAKHTKLVDYEEAIEDQKRYILRLEQEHQSGELNNSEDIKTEKSHLMDLYRMRKIHRGY